MDPARNILQAGSTIRRVRAESIVSNDVISIDHPDILKAIVSRNYPSVRRNTDLVVKVSEAFMAALDDRPNEPHIVIDPHSRRRCLLPREIDLVGYTTADLVMIGHVGFPCFTIGNLWALVMHAVHATGTPAVWFVDNGNEADDSLQRGRIEVVDAVQLPAHATIQDVDRALRLTYRLGRKGVHVHHAGDDDHRNLRASGGIPVADEALWRRRCPLCGFVIVSRSGRFLCDRCVPEPGRRGGQQP